MTHYCVKFHNEDGDWWMTGQGRLWSDSPTDACQFIHYELAKTAADDAEVRMKKADVDRGEFAPRSRVRVITFTPMVESA